MTRPHRPPAPVRSSLFQASARVRFIVALILALLLWGAILWAAR
ncbi:hypothetical protein [Methylobacterium sp. BTF04]|nr:hypothetical protein [Methylobacterium sp. BTF04]